MTTPIKLEYGKRYVRRDGGVTAPLEESGSPMYPFLDPKNTITYTPDGWYCVIWDEEDYRNLVSEYVEEPPQPAITEDWIMGYLTAEVKHGRRLRAERDTPVDGPPPNPAITYLETARDNLANNIGVALREGRTDDAATMALDHFCIGETIKQLAP